MELASASRCIAIFELKIAENFAHGSTDKSFISNLAAFKKEVGRTKYSTIKQQEMNTKKDPPATPTLNEQYYADGAEQSMTPNLCNRACNNVMIGCTILVPTVDTNVEIDAAVAQEFLASGTPRTTIISKKDCIITKDDDVRSPKTVLRMESSASSPDQRGLFCSWEVQQKSINARRRQSTSLDCNRNMTRHKDRLHNWKQQQQQHVQPHPLQKQKLDESSTTTIAIWLETCSI
jgi:hypothetical protein